MEKKVKIEDKEYTVRELKYLEVIEIESEREKNLKEASKKMLIFSTGLSEQEIENLSLKEGLKLQETINEINNFGDFQLPTQEK